MTETPRMEKWKNVCRGRIGIKKFDKFGQLKNETITPGKILTLTTEERLMNSERAANEKLDVFKNGYLIPLEPTMKLLDGTEEAKDIASNPNLLGEKELVKLFKGTQKAFAEKVGGITNTNTLRRLLDMTEDEEVGATVKHQKIVESRLVELEPDLADTIEQIGDDPIRNMKPVSPT